MGAWMPARPRNPCHSDDVSRAGLTPAAICAQTCARGWGPRVPGLSALEQVAPLWGVVGTGRWSPAWLLFGVSCARQVSVRAGVGPSCSIAGPGALTGRKPGPSSCPAEATPATEADFANFRNRAPCEGWGPRPGLGFPPHEAPVRGHRSPAQGPGRVGERGRQERAQEMGPDRWGRVWVLRATKVGPKHCRGVCTLVCVGKPGRQVTGATTPLPSLPLAPPPP